jgi:putative FmdB family regulatory protein
MPIYEYRCAQCGHEHDALQKFSDAPLTECPACHQSSLVKKVSAAGFQLKGSGWYVTDFRSNGASKPAAAKSAEGDAKGGDAKPVEKSGGTSESTSGAGSSGDTSSAATATASSCSPGCACH